MRQITYVPQHARFFCHSHSHVVLLIQRGLLTTLYSVFLCQAPKHVTKTLLVGCGKHFFLCHLPSYTFLQCFILCRRFPLKVFCETFCLAKHMRKAKSGAGMCHSSTHHYIITTHLLLLLAELCHFMSFPGFLSNFHYLLSLSLLYCI